MTTYRVKHVTSYDYDAEMTGGHMVTHLVPRATQFQTVLSSVVTSEPTAAGPWTWIDVFGNLCTYLSIEEPHTWLEVGALSDVVVVEPVLPPDIAWERVADLTMNDTSDAGQLAQWCRQNSPLVGRSHALADYARPSFGLGGGLIEGLRNLTERIFADFSFDPEATDVSTPLDTVLANRRGVCQDFAHLAIGCLRSLGLPARYVSGYIETTPPPGVPKLVGADASHAWCSVYVPGFGWVDADPTNGLLPRLRRCRAGARRYVRPSRQTDPARVRRRHPDRRLTVVTCPSGRRNRPSRHRETEM
jgi:transglutaminase-like putative cysteine protease